MKKRTILRLLAGGIFFLVVQLSFAQSTIWVTSSNDAVSSVPGELRYAITQANLATSPTTIKFNIPGTGPMVINLVALLPVLSKPIVIDATMQAGYSFGNPMVILDGTNGGTPLSIAFNVTSAPYCKILGLYIRNFTDGVNINFSDTCEVSNCVINRTPGRALVFKSSSYCIAKGNFLNTDKALTQFIFSPPLLQEGIFFTNNNTTGSTHNTIGGTGCQDGNTIAYTGSEGIDNDPAATLALNKFNQFSGNVIFGNAYDAIELRSLSNNNLASPVISTTGCTVTGTAGAKQVIELFGSTSADKKNANVFLKSTVTDVSGNWTTTLNSIQYSYITATATDNLFNTSKLCTGVAITPNTLSFSFPGGTLCFGSDVTFTNSSSGCAGTTYMWDYADGSALTASNVHTFLNTGTFAVKLYALSATGCLQRVVSQNVTISPCTPCENCIGSFAPEPADYIINAWVKKETNAPTDLTYTDPQIYIEFPSSAIPTVGPFVGSGPIIDGWQRVEGQFTILSTATYINIKLNCVSGNCMFDDIRVFPVNGSMKSYVYDPTSLRLVAELDERNYATFYEYDEDGKLVRVKKETEKGVMTIKENKNNTKKK